jgi:hypothetical protein
MLHTLIHYGTWPIRTFRTWLARRAAYKIVKESMEAAVRRNTIVKYKLKWEGDVLMVELDLHRPVEHINVSFNIPEEQDTLK